jgi:cell shape-determining protein MreD
MKVFVFYSSLGIAMIVGQTAVLTMPCFRGMFYDLIIPVVVFIRFNLPVRQGILLVFLLGFIMDLFSGGGFGLYLTVYFWIFLGVQAISSFFDVKGNLLRMLLIGLCVLLQNVFFFMFAVFPGRLASAFFPMLGHVTLQVFLGAVTGPAVVKGLECLLRKFKSRQHEVGSTGKDWLAS